MTTSKTTIPIKFYPTDPPKICPHCESIFKQQFFESNVYYSNEIVTVFDAHKRFTNTFNCVLGTKTNFERDLEYNHDFNNLHKLLEGATKFIEKLHEQGITEVRLLINSNYDREKHGIKEHPHALITIVNPSEAYNIFEGEMGKESVTKEPYHGDTIRYLPENHELHKQTTAEEFRRKILSILKFRNFEYSTDNFYIFLNFKCEDDRGTIIGKISTDYTQSNDDNRENISKKLEETKQPEELVILRPGGRGRR